MAPVNSLLRRNYLGESGIENDKRENSNFFHVLEMSRPVAAIHLSTEQSEILTDLSHSRELPHSTVQRAQIVWIMPVEGEPHEDIP